jgi:uncharacterized protein
VVRAGRRVRVPVTVVFGGADSVVPPGQSRAVAQASPQLSRLVRIEGADHNDPALLHGTELVDAVVALADASARRGFR